MLFAYTVGPVTTKVGGNYAWGGQAGLDFTTSSDDNIYVTAKFRARCRSPRFR